jgi:hypothetical protein
MKSIFAFCVIMYMAGIVILAIRRTVWGCRFHRCLREKHPERLKEFWLISGSVLNPIRMWRSLYQVHDIADNELDRLLKKTKGSFTLCYIWLAVGGFVLLLLPFVFSACQLLLRLRR